MSAADIAVIAVTILAYAVVSGRLARSWITMPMVFVAIGAAFDATDVVDLALAIDQVDVLAEVTLAIILFSDALGLNARELRANSALPARLLLIGLPLTIAFGALVNGWLLPGVGFGAAALIASVLAPTDAALGEAIVSDPSVPMRIRDALNVESGLNDGLALPAVLLFVDITTQELSGGGEWVRFLARQVGGGVLLGAVAGGVAAWLVTKALRADWIEGLYAQLAVLATAASTFAAASVFDVNGFIASFVAGLVFGAVAGDRAERLVEYTGDTGSLLATIAFFLFGNLFVVEAFETFGWRAALCAVAALTVVRMVPVAIATLGMGLRPPTVLFLGWYGPRGLASILFGIILLEEEIELGDQLFDLVALVVLASVFLHGLTAAPGAAAYGRWFERTATDAQSMPESESVAMRPMSRRTIRARRT